MPARTATEPEFQAWEAKLEAGVPPAEAARAVAKELTCGSFKRGDKIRYGDALDTSREARGLYVVEKLHENAERAMSPESYEGSVANKALELLGRSAGLFVERHEHEITGRDGGPIELEGRAVVGLADVIDFALRSGNAAALGLDPDAGDPRPALPAASDVLPDPAGDQRPAGVLPAAR